VSKAWLFLLVGLLLGGCTLDALDDRQPQTGLKRARLVVKGAALDVELARTPRQIQKGLMYRESLSEDHGMLFVFGSPGKQCFWMKNTSVPLTAAFLDAQGTVLNMADMEPLSEQLHCSSGQAVYVLEVPRGWFQRHSVVVGDRLAEESPCKIEATGSTSIL
jgi:hypothetical protein